MACTFDDDETSETLEIQIMEYFQSLVDCAVSIMDAKILVVMTLHNFNIFEDIELCDDIVLTQIKGNQHYYTYKDLIEIEVYRIREY